MSSRKEGTTVSLNCFGCVFGLLGLILFFFVLTHISEIWNSLERLIS